MTRTRFNVIITIIHLLIFLPSVYSSIDGQYLGNVSTDSFTIVIDAGHGGKDSGTVGKLSKEKDITLEIALVLGKKLQNIIPSARIIYTRTDDRFIPLFERINLANDVKADLFVSLHCNGIDVSSIRGSETYVIGPHSSEENLSVAKRENSSIIYENDAQRSYYDGYDPDSSASHIVFSLYQNSYLERSMELASEVEKEFAKSGLIKSRGVKQAGFVVLRRATMPSILVETGYITNPTEEKKLMSNEGQRKITDAIAIAIDRYHRSIAEKSGLQVHLTNTQTEIKQISVPPQVSRTQEVEHISEKVKSVPVPRYYVQISASKSQKVGDVLVDTPYHDQIIIKKEGEYFKQLLGSCVSYNEAGKIKDVIIASGHKDCFIVAYLDGHRISLQKAKRINSDR